MPVKLSNEKSKVYGQFPEKGKKALNFNLCGTDLSDINLENFDGNKMILSIFPSVDSITCAHSIRVFNIMLECEPIPNTTILCVSADLPFSLSHFVEREKLENVTMVSCFRSPSFAKDYGVYINDGKLRGLTSRAIIVLDENHNIIYSQLVKDINDEVDYDKVIEMVKL